jgi:N-acetylmuramoyl-L-alanine amidase
MHQHNHLKSTKKTIYIKWLVLASLAFVSYFKPAIAAESSVEGIRFWQSPTKTRVVFDMSAEPEHRLLTLSNPHRVVLDIPKGKVAVDLNKININSTLIERIRSSYNHDKQQLRLVLDLKREAKPNSFTLKPIQNVGNRLVVDLVEAEQQTQQVVKTASDLKKDEIFVVIDAGHGGEDPGAIGHHGTHEKDVVLPIAQKVMAAINRQKGMRAALSRTGDYYLSLRKRSEIARAQGADLFISIHADAFRSPKVRGASVWVLSDKGADSEVGAWLEKRENAADLLGGVESVELNKYEADVAEVLQKIQAEHSVRLSQSIASNVIDELSRVTVVHSPKPRSASFQVLKNPAVPSILIETGFISNSSDEKNLRSVNFQKKVANSITRGVHAYFANNTPVGVKMAALDLEETGPRTHMVSRGETLSGIAVQYGVSLAQLRRSNNIKGDKLFIGKSLIIPI